MIDDDAELIGLERSTNKPYELTHNLEELAKKEGKNPHGNFTKARTEFSTKLEKGSPKCRFK